MNAFRCFIITIAIVVLSTSVSNAQFTPIEYEMGKIDMKEVNPAIEYAKSSGDYLKPSAVNSILDSTLNEKVTVPSNTLLKKQLSGTEIYQRLKKSTIVLISANIRASGFIISPDGICVTNFHVVKRFSDTTTGEMPLLAMSAEHQFYPVTEVLSCSEINDIAIIKIDTKGDKLLPLTLSKTAKEGSTVFVMGHPSHILYYMAEGIVAKNFIKHPDSLHQHEQARMAVTADYSLGESGGPIVNNQCNVVGMVSSATALYGSPENQSNPQMVVKSAIPVVAIRQLIVGADAD